MKRRMKVARGRWMGAGRATMVGLSTLLAGVPAYAQDAGHAGAPAVANAESARVSGFLESRYKASDVRHSFRTMFGETIDCIDFAAQPGVKELAKQGITVPIPAAVNVDPGSLPAAIADVAFLGQPDEAGNSRACLPPTVPILRIEARDVAAQGGLDSFVVRHAGKHRRPESQGQGAQARPPSGSIFLYAFEQSTITSGITLVKGTFNVFDINGVRGGDHSLAQFWLTNGGSISNGSAPGTDQTVEVGINVDPSLYPSAPSIPHLFAYSTTDGYFRTGCYNNVGSGCVPWVTSPGAPFTLGQALSAGSIGSTQVELTIMVQLNPDPGGAWSVAVASGTSHPLTIGYYPLSAYSGSMKTGALVGEVGGEVSEADPGASTSMGRGGNAAAGALGAAYVRNFIAQGSGSCSGSQAQTCWQVQTPNAADYELSTTTAAGSGWGNYFYYGNTSRVFWGTNYGFQWSPVGDWSVGSYKGECPPNHAVVGVSKLTSSTASHAVRCGSIPLASATACNLRTVGQRESRGYSGTGDWDPNSYKTECKQNEYVAGISQTTAGVLNGVLCCASSSGVSHATCATEVLGNAHSAGSADYFDWDLGYYKARCSDSSNYYMAGISTPSSGTLGGAHAILCCRQ